MKKLMIMLMMVTTILFSSDADIIKQAKFIRYEMKVLDYSEQIMLKYTEQRYNLVKGDLVTGKQLITYFRVCILVKYKDVIEKGYKLNPDDPMDTVSMVFDTKLKKCINKD